MSSSVSDRWGQPVVEIVAKSFDSSVQPVVERGQELNTEHAQIRTFFGPTEGANPRRLSGGNQETRIPG